MGNIQMYTKHIQLRKLKSGSAEKLTASIHQELKQYKLSEIDYSHPNISFIPTLWFLTSNLGKNLSPITSGQIAFDESKSIIEITISYKLLLVVCFMFPIPAFWPFLSNPNFDSFIFLAFGVFISWGVLFNSGRFFSMIALNKVIKRCVKQSGYMVVNR